MEVIKKSRVRKSVKLSEQEYEAFKTWVVDQGTKVDAALRLKVAPNTLDRILLAGSGSEVNIKKVRRKISSLLSSSAA